MKVLTNILTENINNTHIDIYIEYTSIIIYAKVQALGFRYSKSVKKNYNLFYLN